MVSSPFRLWNPHPSLLINVTEGAVAKAPYNLFHSDLSPHREGGSISLATGGCEGSSSHYRSLSDGCLTGQSTEEKVSGQRPAWVTPLGLLKPEWRRRMSGWIKVEGVWEQVDGFCIPCYYGKDAGKREWVGDSKKGDLSWGKCDHDGRQILENLIKIATES